VSDSTPAMTWLHEPPQWTFEQGGLAVTAAPKTDFWRKTHNQQVADNGHFFYQTVTGDFTASVRFRGQYRALYDQAGLMVRVDPAHWIKCGIEFVDGVHFASAVVTRDYSDWSLAPLAQAPETFWLRVVRRQVTFEVYWALDGATYHLLRQAYLHDSGTVQVGMMICAPVGEGFEARFEGFQVVQNGAET